MAKFRPEDLIQFQVRKEVGKLYKSFLVELEEVKNAHRAMIEKLEATLPKEYHSLVLASDTLTENNFAYLRKKVLDSGNDAIRNIAEQLDKFNIEF